MQDLTAESLRRLDALATRHGVSMDAATTLLRAVAAGGGSMAQFSHPDLGGMGQWSPGMTMVGDMFNQSLKQRVNALCTDLAALLREGPLPGAAGSSQGQPGAGFGFSSGTWWPAELGVPASSGGQNDMRYAYFPAARRLAVQQDGRLSLYETGDSQVFGVSQQQGTAQSLIFSTSRGTARLEDFSRVDLPGTQPLTASPKAAADLAETGVPGAAEQAGLQPAQPASAGFSAIPEVRPGAAPAAGDPLAMIERLADLQAKGILTAEEFAATKAELLGRL